MSNRIITLLRHGSVDGPAALYGQTDIGLNADGQRAAQHAIRHLHQLAPITHVVSSPLMRCLSSAREFSQLSQLPLRIIDGLKEMHFGSWDGVAFDEFTDAQWQLLNKFWETPASAHAPQGESLKDFAARVINAWQDIEASTSAAHQLVLCHGGVIRIIIAHLLKLDWCNASLFRQLTIDYASNTRIEIVNSDALPIIKHIGETIHR